MLPDLSECDRLYIAADASYGANERAKAMAGWLRDVAIPNIGEEMSLTIAAVDLFARDLEQLGLILPEPAAYEADPLAYLETWAAFFDRVGYLTSDASLARVAPSSGTLQ